MEGALLKIKEYLTSYESINEIEQLEKPENNETLDETTFVEMVRRYLIVHDKVLNIINEILESKGEE